MAESWVFFIGPFTMKVAYYFVQILHRPKYCRFAWLVLSRVDLNKHHTSSSLIFDTFICWINDVTHMVIRKHFPSIVIISWNSSGAGYERATKAQGSSYETEVVLSRRVLIRISLLHVVWWKASLKFRIKIIQNRITTVNKESKKQKITKRGATRGLPRGSPILVLLSPKHA